MNSLKFFVLLTLFLGLTGCSVYKSAGRKSFEGRAPEAVRSLQSEDLCWSQLATEPLWDINDEQILTVTKLGDDQIQVCTSNHEENQNAL
jgi:hypothetical protein